VSDWNVGLDRTAPTDSNATGSMSQRNGAIGAGPQTLGVDTADSLSGVQAVDLFVNGTSVGHVAGSCSAGQCTTTKHADCTRDSSNTSGRVTVMVRVTDQVGNKFDDTWALAV